MQKVILSVVAEEDPDLYVVDPLGNEIYWNNRVVNYPKEGESAQQATEGARHLPEPNWSCAATEGDNDEEIVWDPGSAPPGEYTVKVKYYEHCAAETVDYTVTVVIGETATEYSGSFVAAEEDKTVEVTSFTL